MAPYHPMDKMSRDQKLIRLFRDQIDNFQSVYQDSLSLMWKTFSFYEGNQIPYEAVREIIHRGQPPRNL